MNRTDKKTRASDSRDRLLRLLPAALALIGVAATTASGEYAGTVFLSSLLAAVGYLLAIVGYYAFTRCVWAAEWLLPLLVAMAVVATGYLLGGLKTLQPVGLAVALIAVPSLLVGSMSRSRRTPGSWYQVGLLVILAIIAVFEVPRWLTTSANIGQTAPLIVEDLAARLAGLGIHADTSGAWTAAWETRLRLLAWLIPGLMATSVLVQYSLGVLWFAGRTPMIRKHPRMRFANWRMPRFWLPVLLAAVVLHFVDGEIVQQVADCTLFGLGVYLAVFGLAALEHVMTNWHWPLWAKVIVYLVITISHLYGLLLLSVLGIVRMLLPRRQLIAVEN